MGAVHISTRVAATRSSSGAELLEDQKHLLWSNHKLVW